MAEKPTIIFVPGAWHSPEVFRPVVSRLEVAGYSVKLVELASVGASEQLKNFDPDVVRIREAIESTVNEEKNALIVVHSYGSMPANEAIKGFERKDLAKEGKRGGVVHLFFCTSFVVPEGKSLLDTLSGNDPPWFEVSEDKMIVNAKDPKKMFYNDMDEETTQKMVEGLSTHSYKTMSSKCKFAAWKRVPSTYLYCKQDNAIPLEVQKGMVEDSGVKFSTETVDAGHSPFISVPDEMTKAIRRAAGETI